MLFPKTRHPSSNPGVHRRVAKIGLTVFCLAVQACSGEAESNAVVLPTVTLSTQHQVDSSSGISTAPRTGVSSGPGASTSTAASLGQGNATATDASSSSDTAGSGSSNSDTTSSDTANSGITSSDTTSSDTTSSDTTSSDTTSSDTTSSDSSSSDAAGVDPSDCLNPCEQGAVDPWADCVPEFAPAPETANAGSPFNHDKMPDIVLGPPRGTMDTVSLGCGGQLTLGFVGPGIIDGPGPDFIVFENPFPGFPEPARIEVSQDGCTFVSFPCDPVSLAGCAGVTPVLANQSNDIDPSDPSAAGGDAFDLEDVGLTQVRFVRVVDVSAEHWTPQGLSYCDPAPMAGDGKGGSDIDTIVAVPRP